jgi:DNA-binding LacI/PurR family transcriptional regulator
VSPSVVSAVVNGHEDRIFVSDATRERVLTVVRETGYQPRQTRRPQEPPPESVRVAIVSPVSHLAIFSVTIAQLSEALSENDCIPIAHVVPEPVEERWAQTERLYEGKQAQAFVFLGSTHVPISRLAAHVPLVVIGEVLPEDEDRAWRVCLDNHHAGQTIAHYLWALGHRRAGIAGYLEPTYTRDRIGAFIRSWVDRGGVWSDDLEFDLPSGPDATVQTALQTGLRDFLDGAERRLGGPLTALFCMTDFQAALTMRAVQRLGLRVPEDLSIVSIDDWPLLAEGLNPRLTTLRQPFAALGRVAAQLLQERLHGSRQPRRVLLPGELIVRESCASARVLHGAPSL